MGAQVNSEALDVTIVRIGENALEYSPDDSLVDRYVRKSAELKEIGQQIRASARPVTVMFVDLVGSTAMKRQEADRWLGYIYEFLKVLDSLVSAVGGTIVKRIGDEVMVAFSHASGAERLIDSMSSNADFLERFAVRIAVDSGEAYYLRFGASLPDDPYGVVVDRCARLAKVGAPQSVIASKDYVLALKDEAKYLEGPHITLKGFDKPTALYARQLGTSGSDDYWEPIVKALNDSSTRYHSYRSVPRSFSAQYFSYRSRGQARPFLLRELFNLPQYPGSAATLYARLDNQDEDSRAEYLGYLIEWTLHFGSFSFLDAEDLMAFFDVSDEPFTRHVVALMPYAMADVLRSLRKGERVVLRGVISKVPETSIHINYAEVAVTHSV